MCGICGVVGLDPGVAAEPRRRRFHQREQHVDACAHVRREHDRDGERVARELGLLFRRESRGAHDRASAVPLPLRMCGNLFSPDSDL